SFVGLGRLVEPADLAHVLQRCRANLRIRHRGCEIEEHPDVSAHRRSSVSTGSMLNVSPKRARCSGTNVSHYALGGAGASMLASRASSHRPRSRLSRVSVWP